MKAKLLILVNASNINFYRDNCNLNLFQISNVVEMLGLSVW